MKREPVNRHHVLYSRPVWTSFADLTAIRSKPQLIVPLDIQVHKELHGKVSHVPPFDHYLAKLVLREFIPYRDDPVKSIESLMGCIELARNHHTVDRIQHEIGSVTIHALERQIPYIKEGYTPLNAAA